MMCCRFDDNPFSISSENRYSNNWSASLSSNSNSGTTGGSWNNDKFDNKQSSSIVEDIPSKNTNAADTW